MTESQSPLLIFLNVVSRVIPGVVNQNVDGSDFIGNPCDALLAGIEIRNVDRVGAEFATGVPLLLVNLAVAFKNGVDPRQIRPELLGCRPFTPTVSGRN